MKMSNADKCSRYYYRHREMRLAQDKIYYQMNRNRKLEYARRHRSEHPLLNVFISMMRRCGEYEGAGPEDQKIYKSRGIRVCDSWKSFPVFESWAVSHGWEKGLVLDRIDNEKGYSPENCRFITQKENARNKRNNMIVEFRNQKMPLSAAVELSGTNLKYSTVHLRLTAGWSLEDALYRPSRKKKLSLKKTI